MLQPYGRSFIVINRMWENKEGETCEAIKCVCKIEATALRMGKDQFKDRNGQFGNRDCPIREVDLFMFEGMVYGPVTVFSPTPEDTRHQEKMDTYRKVVEKAKEVGLTKEEISLLTRKP